MEKRKIGKEKQKILYDSHQPERLGWNQNNSFFFHSVDRDNHWTSVNSKNTAACAPNCTRYKPKYDLRFKNEFKANLDRRPIQAVFYKAIKEAEDTEEKCQRLELKSRVLESKDTRGQFILQLRI